MEQKIGSLGWALDKLKTGSRITRREFGNSKITIRYVAPRIADIAEKVVGVVGGEFRHGKIHFREHYVMVNNEGLEILWECSQGDLLNNDYEEVS